MSLSSLSSLGAHSTDWIVLGVFAAIVAFDAYRSGSGRAIALALAFPLTLYLMTALSGAAILGPLTKQFASGTAQSILFALLCVALFLAVYRMTFRYGNGGIVQALLSAIALTAVVAVVWLQVPGLIALWHFGPQIQAVFGDTYRFWWIAGAYSALAFTRS